MAKLKCAILGASESQSLPTLSELETGQTTNVLYGLGNYTPVSIPYSTLLPMVLMNFELVQSHFPPPHWLSDDELDLVIFDYSIDEIVFQLAYSSIVKCKFLIDEQVAKDITTTSRKMIAIHDSVSDALAVADTVDDIITVGFGDDVFQAGLPQLKRGLGEYANGLKRASSEFEQHLKDVYGGGW